MKVITQYLAPDNSPQIHEEEVNHPSQKQLAGAVQNRVQEILTTYLKVKDEASGEVGYIPAARILSVTVAENGHND